MTGRAFETDHRPSAVSSGLGRGAPPTTLKRKTLKNARVDIRLQTYEIAHDLVKIVDPDKRRIDAGGDSLDKQLMDSRQRRVFAPVQPEQSRRKRAGLHGFVDGVHDGRIPAAVPYDDEAKAPT